MEIFSNLNDSLGNADQNSINDQHAVIINFNYEYEELDPLHELENRLLDLLTDPEVGYYDGHEVGLDSPDGTLFFYGPNAEKLFKAVKQELESTDFLQGATAQLFFGPSRSGVSEISVTIGED